MAVALKEALREALSRLGKPSLIETSLTFLYWNEAVGEGISKKVKPQFIKKGTLFVTTASPSWAQELEFLKPKLLEALNQRLGKKFLTDIRTIKSNSPRPFKFL